MKLIYFILIIINFYCKLSYAQTIAVINIQSLIDNHVEYYNVIKEIESVQDKYFKNFENKENELKLILKSIDESRLILSETEINNQIYDYNQKLNNFSIEVEKFNSHYQNQIFNLRDSILNEIILLLQEYAIKKNIDLILDSTSYLVAANSIDITEIIEDELNKINIKLEYKNFEKN